MKVNRLRLGRPRVAVRLLASAALGGAALLGAGRASAQAAPYQDSKVYASTAAGSTAGVLAKGELSIVRERSFSTTPPTMAGSGVALGAGPTKDGLFSESIFFRTGPTSNAAANPETRGT